MDGQIGDPWTALRPDDASREFAQLTTRWWVCGGWSIDLWLGRDTREHADLDIGCFRNDVAQMCDDLSDWEIFTAHEGVLARLPAGTDVPAHISSLWCRRAGSPSWDVQVMIEESDGLTWRFRRDTRVEQAADLITWWSEVGVASLRPEVQLLYKAKEVRSHDQADFDHVLPTLGPAAREWLSKSLRLVHPGHPWLLHLSVG